MRGSTVLHNLHKVISNKDNQTSTLKTTWSVRGLLFLLQNHVIQYKLYLL